MRRTKSGKKTSVHWPTNRPQLQTTYNFHTTVNLRSIYDQYNEDGLKKGVVDAKGVPSGGWSFNKSPIQVFADFFGTSVPPEAGAEVKEQKESTKGEDVEHNLYCSLEELYTGCTKVVKLSKKVLNDDQSSNRTEAKLLSINVGPGWKNGTKITFKNEGDEIADKTPGDVTYILREKPHPLFHREGKNLVRKVNLSLRQALTGANLDITTLDGRVLPVAVTDIVK